MKHFHAWFIPLMVLTAWAKGLDAQTNTPAVTITTPQAAAPSIAPSKSIPLPKPFTTINSDMLDFDYDKRIATFEGNVVAVDPKLTLKCKTMKVFFAEKDDDVIRVEAYNNVQMFHDHKEALGEKAVFTRETEIIVLSGGDCRLKDEKANWIRSRGAGIIYNIRTRQMHVDKPTLEFQTSTTPDLLKTPTPK